MSHVVRKQVSYPVRSLAHSPCASRMQLVSQTLTLPYSTYDSAVMEDHAGDDVKHRPVCVCVCVCVFCVVCVYVVVCGGGTCVCSSGAVVYKVPESHT